MESYSQCGQDIFVTNFIKNKGTYLDLGCFLPKKINNTYLLELNGWTGVSIDINNYSELWKQERKNVFLREDCFSIDFKTLLPIYYSNNVIDYLSLDMESLGDRYRLLENVLKSNYKFKIITMEHDGYLGEEYINKEKIPQRELLKNNGYILLCADVSHIKDPNSFYEDWWINPEYFKESDYKNWFCEKVTCGYIFEKNQIDYKINDISKSW